jgi:hypothetical protein
MLAGSSSYNEFLCDFQCTNIEFDIKNKPGHTHAAVGTSNAKGIHKRMCGEVFVSHISVGTKYFWLHHYQRVFLNICLDLWVFE